MGAGRWAGCFVLAACGLGCDCEYEVRLDGPLGQGIVDRDASVTYVLSDQAATDDAGPEDEDTHDAGRVDGGVVDAGGDDADGGDGASGADGGVLLPQGETLRVDRALGFAVAVRVAIDGNDNATVVWTEVSGIFTKRWERGEWGENVILGAGDDPSVDFNASGGGVVTWRDERAASTMARLWLPGSGWLPSEAIGSGGGYAGVVAMAGTGSAVALFNWSYDDDARVHATRYDPGAGWQEEALLEPAATRTRMPDVAANEQGDFVGVWTNLEVAEEKETAWCGRQTGSWVPITQLGSDSSASMPRVAIDGDGNAFAAWPNHGDGTIWVARQSSRGEYTSTQSVGASSGSINMEIAASADGSAFVVWTTETDVRVARYDEDGGWESSTVDVLEDGLDSFEMVDVAADDRGGALVVWAQAEGGWDRIWSSRYHEGDGWLDPVRVDEAGDADATRPRVDMSPGGTAIVGWNQRTEDSSEIWGRILAP